MKFLSQYDDDEKIQIFEAEINSNIAKNFQGKMYNMI